MLRSIPSLAHVLLPSGLLLYVYGVLGSQLFRDDDPDRWSFRNPQREGVPQARPGGCYHGHVVMTMSGRERP